MVGTCTEVSYVSLHICLSTYIEAVALVRALDVSIIRLYIGFRAFLILRASRHAVFSSIVSLSFTISVSAVPILSGCCDGAKKPQRFIGYYRVSIAALALFVVCILGSRWVCCIMLLVVSYRSLSYCSCAAWRCRGGQSFCRHSNSADLVYMYTDKGQATCPTTEASRTSSSSSAG